MAITIMTRELLATAQEKATFTHEHRNVQMWAERLDMLDNAPVLSGSEKQVAWATDIRNNIVCMELPSLDSVIRAEKAFATDEQIAAMRETYIPAIMRMITEQTEATWWIDNRNEFSMSQRALVAFGFQLPS